LVGWRFVAALAFAEDSEPAFSRTGAIRATIWTARSVERLRWRLNFVKDHAPSGHPQTPPEDIEILGHSGMDG